MGLGGFFVGCPELKMFLPPQAPRSPKAVFGLFATSAEAIRESGRGMSATFHISYEKWRGRQKRFQQLLLGAKSAALLYLLKVTKLNTLKLSNLVVVHQRWKFSGGKILPAFSVGFILLRTVVARRRRRAFHTSGISGAEYKIWMTSRNFPPFGQQSEEWMLPDSKSQHRHYLFLARPRIRRRRFGNTRHLPS